MFRTDMRPRPQPDATFFAMRGGAVVLSGAEGRLYALDPASALCWLSLEARDPRAEAVAALQEAAGLSHAAAEAWYRGAIQQFADAALLEGTAPPPGEPPVLSPPPRSDLPLSPIAEPVTLQARLGIVTFVLTLPRALATLAAGMLSPALCPKLSKTAERKALKVAVQTVDGTYLLTASDSVLLEAPPDLDAASALEFLLVNLAVLRTPHLTVLHAALLGRGDSGLLITGVSGAGKTTLSATLAAAGWRYGSDERVLLSEDAKTALPLPIAPCVKASAVPTLRQLFPTLDSEPEYPRYGRHVRYLQLPRADPAPMNLRAVVFPERQPGVVPELHDIAPLDGLRRLMEQCLRVPRGFGPAEVQRLLDWHDGITYSALRYSEATSAVALLEPLVAA